MNREFENGRRLRAVVRDCADGQWELRVYQDGELVSRTWWGGEAEAEAALRLVGPRGWRELVRAGDR